MLTVEKPLAGKIGQREADRLASGADHIRQELVRQWEIWCQRQV